MKDADLQSPQPNPWKQFIIDLMKCIKEWQHKNHEIILYLDANDKLGEESQGITKLIRNCGLVDFLNVGEFEAN